MRIYWKALVGYGFVFWVLLCITDLLGITDIHKYSKDLDELYDKPKVVKEIEKKFQPHLNRLEYRGIKFGWSLLVWNTVTFVFSIIVCTLGQTFGWIVLNCYKSYRNKIALSKINIANSQYSRSVTALSKIPVMVKPLSRSSDSNVLDLDTKSKVDVDKSCPNLLMKRSGSNMSSLTDITSRTTRTIFRKDLFIHEQADLSIEQHLERQCRKLKEELHRLQTTSLKEHAILSRKLDTVTKDKKELGKQFVTAQKENRAAKQQIEELLQEKASLIRKLDTATKEFKCNTKAKKFALVKLEEVTNSVDMLRQQLEQVSRDKEILEKKLRLLEIEYNKLHERYIISQQRFSADGNNNIHLPERDENNSKGKVDHNESLNYFDSNSIPPALQQTAEVLASVSQTELDMKKIQEKIKRLEKNLENLNVCNDLECNGSLDHFESDLSLSTLDQTTDSMNRIEDESGTTLSGFSSSNSPRHRYFSERVAEIIGRNKNKFAKIQALARQMQEKARYLGNIRENTEIVEDINDAESSESDEREPKRMVSNSVAFKNFLKSLNKLDAAKQQLPSRSEVYF